MLVMNGQWKGCLQGLWQSVQASVCVHDQGGCCFQPLHTGPQWGKEHSGLAAATAAKSLQSCLTPCNPIGGSPPGFSIPGILQARTMEWVAISFSNAWKWKVKVKLLSCVQLLATPWTAAHQAPQSMGFFQARVLEWGAIAFSALTV